MALPGDVHVLEARFLQPSQLIGESRAAIETCAGERGDEVLVAHVRRAKVLLPAALIGRLDLGRGSERLIRVDEDSARRERGMDLAEQASLRLMLQMMDGERRDDRFDRAAERRGV